MLRKIIRSMGWLCGYAAACAQVVAYVWYGRELLSGAVETNPISWWLWVAETGIGLAIYVDLTGDRSKWISEAMAMVGVVVVAGFLTVEAVMGQAADVFASVVPGDYLSTVIAVVVFVRWLATRKMLGAGFASWLFQIVLFLAAFPLIRAVYADPSAEPFGPWAIWTGAFALQTLCAILRWEKGKDDITSLLNPVNYVITHGLVTWIVWHGGAL